MKREYIDPVVNPAGAAKPLPETAVNSASEMVMNLEDVEDVSQISRLVAGKLE